MVLALNKEQLAFNSVTESVEDMVNDVRKYISERECPVLSMDISNLNLIDASKFTILCSTYHWAKYPQGKINLAINSDEVKNLVKSLQLGNIIFQ
jgi:ABC-type transporter Mla MlaB component